MFTNANERAQTQTNAEFRLSEMGPKIRRPHSTYKKVVQGKCTLHFLHFNGVVYSNTLFSNTSALTNSLLLRANSPCKVPEHLVWSNTSGFRFWGPLARTNFLSALCGLPIKCSEMHTNASKRRQTHPFTQRRRADNKNNIFAF